MKSKPARLAVVLALVWACGATDPEPATLPVDAPWATVGALRVHNPTVALFPGMGALYFSVANHSQTDDRLVRVESADAAVVETHESINDDGVMRMVAHPDGFEVPANGTLVLAPGGKHIMLIAPDLHDADAGVRVELIFEQAGSVTLVVPVTDPAAAQKPNDVGAGSAQSAHSEELEG